MQDDDCGYAILEFLVLGLVVPYLHAKPRADAAADDGKEQQCCFGYSPFLLPCLILVDAIGKERGNIGGCEIDQYVMR